MVKLKFGPMLHKESSEMAHYTNPASEYDGAPQRPSPLDPDDGFLLSFFCFLFW